jgi:hypothetical protein
MVKPLSDAVDELLDREQGDQHARERNCRVERRDRRARWQPKTAKPSDIVDIAEPDQAERHAEDREANDDFHDQPRRAAQRLRDRSQVQVVIATGGDRASDENRIHEQCRGDFLQPQPGPADGPRHDVSRYGEREAETQHAAKDHQDQFELVERPPF